MTVDDLTRNLPIARDLIQSAALALRPAPSHGLAGHVGILGLGVVLGAGFALLYAPKAGRQLRREISASFDSAVRETEEIVERKLRDHSTAVRA